MDPNAVVGFKVSSYDLQTRARDHTYRHKCQSDISVSRFSFACLFFFWGGGVM